MKPNRTWPGVLLDGLIIFLLSAILIQPLFKVKYTVAWNSIESTFIADGRFLKDHWPHPRWQPLWYCGTRFDYVYPPALRYGTAALVRAFALEPVRAYHLYIAVFYCIGIAGVYGFIRAAGRARGEAWLGAALAALVSPSFLLLANYRHDAWMRHPLRLGVLVRWGEGPHMTALALIPIALACVAAGLRRGRPAALAGGAAGMALVVSHNFYGALALAMLFAVLVWSVWITHRDRHVWGR